MSVFDPTAHEVIRPLASKGGRPRKARRWPTGGDKGVDKWTIRGVPMNVRQLAKAEADRQGMTLGDWVCDALVAPAHKPADINFYHERHSGASLIECAFTAAAVAIVVCAFFTVML